MTTDFYNDIEPSACAWMGELMAGGHIPAGRIDNRSILDVRPTDLAGARRAHFFAGIGGWAEALRIAGWPDDEPVWTGSPPCQPFSAAGQRRGRDDDRHLGPAFVDLVRACKPRVLFGEQVASAEVVGRVAGGAKRGAGAEPAWAWCDDLFVRLEAAGYACGAAVVPACSVGAPHIRARLFFGAVRLADADDARLEGRREPERERAAERPAGPRGVAGGLADPISAAVRRHPRDPRSQAGTSGGETWAEDGHAAACASGARRPGPTDGVWRDADWLGCQDGRWRPAQSSVQRVVDGLPGSVVPGGDFVPAAYPLAQKQERRVMRLRGYGNAIVPQVAAEFVRAFRQSLPVVGA